MGDIGLLLSLPTESIAVRVAIASVIAVAVARLLFHAGLRSPRVRAALAMVPAAAILVVLAVSAAAPAPPSVWHTVNASGGLTIPVRDTYLSFAPATWPLVVGVWSLVALARLTTRVVRHARAARGLQALRDAGDEAPAAVTRTVARLSAALRIVSPPVVVVPSLAGGAAVVGMREPVVLLDSTLVALLDDEELAGVVAHELAHVQRRDNLAAFALCVLRDVLFFVPGGRWSLRMLLREREHAADTVAVDVTERPGALASGLLKVLESRGRRDVVACSPLLSEGTLVDRVQQLCDERPRLRRPRRAFESAVTVAAIAASVVTAVAVPAWIVGDHHQREALGVLLSEVRSAVPDVAQPTAVFRAFEDDSAATPTATEAPDASSPPVTPATPGDGRLFELDDVDHAGPIGFEACRLALQSCRDNAGRPRVSLPPQPIVRVDDAAVDRWQLDPIVRSGNQENALFWFSRLSAG